MRNPILYSASRRELLFAEEGWLPSSHAEALLAFNAAGKQPCCFASSKVLGIDLYLNPVWYFYGQVPLPNTDESTLKCLERESWIPLE